MPTNNLSIRELTLQDMDVFISYWLDSDETHVKNMGVDSKKLPGKEQFFQYWTSQLARPTEQRDSYCILWEVDERPVGHSSTRPTIFGEKAYMHLHLWNADDRKKGLGTAFLKLTIPHFFKTLQLKELYCEPYALNPAPNAALKKLGFEFIKAHTTTPGPATFEQPVNLWRMTFNSFEADNLMSSR